MVNILTSTNSIPDICELEIRVIRDYLEENDYTCIADLRLCSSEIPLGGQECEIGFRRLTISVDVEGLKVIPGSRFGEPKKANYVPSSTELAERSCSKVESEYGGGASTTGKNINFNARAKRNKKDNQSTEKTKLTNSDEGFFLVRAQPNLRWMVSEPSDNLLDGTYLEEEILFQLKPTDTSNRKNISIDVRVKQRDLVINQIIQTQSAINFFSSFNTNQRRLIDIFIAKSLSAKLYNGNYIGEILLSKFEFIDEN